MVAKDIEALFEKGLEVRKQVLGAAHVERSLAAADDFSRPLQELVTAFAWGGVWARSGLSRRERSLINVAMLTALGKTDELAHHVRGALTNGVTKDEISEVLVQTAIYAGFPAALAAIRVARKAIEDSEKESSAT
jgi:4-carboxymuconolactone decarboxylase